MKLVFFFSNRYNSNDNIFVNNLIDKLNLDVVKINVDNRKININSTPALKVNDKILYKKESLIFLGKLQNINNKKVSNNIVKKKNEIVKNNNIDTPNTFDQLEMNNFSDTYSFIDDSKKPLLSKYEYINNESSNNIIPQSNNLNTISSNDLSITNDKKKYNEKSYNDYLQNRANDPYIKK